MHFRILENRLQLNPAGLTSLYILPDQLLYFSMTAIYLLAYWSDHFDFRKHKPARNAKSLITDRRMPLVSLKTLTLRQYVWLGRRVSCPRLSQSPSSELGKVTKDLHTKAHAHLSHDWVERVPPEMIVTQPHLTLIWSSPSIPDSRLRQVCLEICLDTTSLHTPG